MFDRRISWWTSEVFFCNEYLDSKKTTWIPLSPNISPDYGINREGLWLSGHITRASISPRTTSRQSFITRSTSLELLQWPSQASGFDVEGEQEPVSEYFSFRVLEYDNSGCIRLIGSMIWGLNVSQTCLSFQSIGYYQSHSGGIWVLTGVPTRR